MEGRHERQTEPPRDTWLADMRFALLISWVLWWLSQTASMLSMAMSTLTMPCAGCDGSA